MDDKGILTSAGYSGGGSPPDILPDLPEVIPKVPENTAKQRLQGHHNKNDNGKGKLHLVSADGTFRAGAFISAAFIPTAFTSAAFLIHSPSAFAS